MTLEELENLVIRDTKRSEKENIIYCALGKPEDVREIHYRRAISENKNLITRDYIPPQLYQRYMSLAKKASEKCAEDKTLKTQIRWGTRDPRDLHENQRQ